LNRVWFIGENLKICSVGVPPGTGKGKTALEDLCWARSLQGPGRLLVIPGSDWRLPKQVVNIQPPVGLINMGTVSLTGD